jgi:hypothetical protein
MLASREDFEIIPFLEDGAVACWDIQAIRRNAIRDMQRGSSKSSNTQESDNIILDSSCASLAVHLYLVRPDTYRCEFRRSQELIRNEN